MMKMMMTTRREGWMVVVQSVGWVNLALLTRVQKRTNLPKVMRVCATLFCASPSPSQSHRNLAV